MYDFVSKKKWLEEKLGERGSLFRIRDEKGIVVANYCPYNLDFVYIPEGKYNKGLSEREKVQAKRINEAVIFSDKEMEYEEEIHVGDMLVTRTPILNAFAHKFIDFHYYKGEENLAAYLNKEKVDLLCEKLSLRLPTEIEWEYFVRAGSRDLFPFGAQLPNELELERWLSFDFTNLDEITCNKFGLYGVFTGEWTNSNMEDGYVIKGGGAYFWPWQADEWIWCMSAMRMSSKGLIDGECGVRLVYDFDK